MYTPINDVLLAAIQKVTDFENDLWRDLSLSSEDKESDYLSDDIEGNKVNISLKMGKKMSSLMALNMKKSSS